MIEAEPPTRRDGTGGRGIDRIPAVGSVDGLPVGCSPAGAGDRGLGRFPGKTCRHSSGVTWSRTRRKKTPPVVRFKDGAGLIKPVCPVLEVWARYEDEGEFLPLTTRELGDLNLTRAAVTWDVTFANLKMLRRTGEPGDLASAVAFLASDDAAWITGVILDVTGGAVTV